MLSWYIHTWSVERLSVLRDRGMCFMSDLLNYCSIGGLIELQCQGDHYSYSGDSFVSTQRVSLGRGFEVYNCTRLLGVTICCF